MKIIKFTNYLLVADKIVAIGAVKKVARVFQENKKAPETREMWQFHVYLVNMMVPSEDFITCENAQAAKTKLIGELMQE